MLFKTNRKSMSALAQSESNTPPRKLFLIGLLASVFAVNVIDVFAPLLYPEIAATFGITVGTAVQLSAFSALAGGITALVLSAFSIKFRYKTLLMAGVLSIVICTVGVFLAPNFLFAQIFYAFNGVGSMIVGVMAPTLIAEFYPLEKKAKRVSLVLAAGTFALLIGNPVTGFIASTGGVTSWRSVLLWFMLPVTFICLMLVFFLVPSKPASNPLGTKKQPFLNGFKEILTNPSPRACLTNSFFTGVYFSVNIFALSFLKDVFSVTAAFRSLVALTGSSLMISGMLIGGLFVNAVGRKRLLVVAAIPGIVFSVCGYPLSIFIPNVWIVLPLRFLSAFIGGFAIIAGSNLVLEQVPKFRGTLMSLTSFLQAMGGATGIIVGGALLNIIGYPIIGYPVAMVTLGVLGLIGTLNIVVFAKDPVKNPPKRIQMFLGDELGGNI
jgi:predicted MFS family arabinose efflux permease